MRKTNVQHYVLDIRFNVAHVVSYIKKDQFSGCGGVEPGSGHCRIASYQPASIDKYTLKYILIYIV